MKIRYLFTCGLLLVLPQYCFSEFEVLIAPTPESTENQFIWRVEPGKWYQLESTPDLTGVWGTQEVFQAESPVFVHSKGVWDSGFYRLKRIDQCPPKILSYYPYSDAYSVPRYSRINILLDDETGIDPSSISLIVSTNGTFTLADPELSLFTNNLVFNPMGTPLGDYGEKIDLTLNVSDINDNNLTFNWSAELEYQDVPVSNLFVFGSPSAVTYGQQLSATELEFAMTSGLTYPTPPPPVKWRILNISTNQIVLNVDDQQTMVFLESILLPGVPIANAAVDHIDEFFYRRIKSTASSLPLMTLQTENVPLEALFESYSYKLDKTSAVRYERDSEGNIFFPVPDITANAVTVELFDFNNSYHLIDKTWDWSDKEFFQGNSHVAITFDRLDLSIESYADVAGKFTLSTSSSRREMEFSAALTTSFNAGVLPVIDVNISESYEDSGTIVPEFTLLDWTVWIGYVPLPFELNFGTTWEAYVEGELNATITGGFTFDKTTTYWADYDYYRSTRFQTGKEVSGPGLEMVPITATAEGSLGAGVAVVPYLELAVGPSVTIAGAEVEAQAGVRGEIRAYADLTVNVISTSYELPIGRGGPAETDGYDMRASLTAGLGWEILAFYSLVLDAPWPFNSLDTRRSGELEIVSGDLIDPLVEHWRIHTVEEPTIGDIRDYFDTGITDAYIPDTMTSSSRNGLPINNTLQRKSSIVIPSVVVTNTSGEIVDGFDGGYSTQWYTDGIPIPGMTGKTLYFGSPSGKLDGNYSSIASRYGSSLESPVSQISSIPEGARLESPVAEIPAELLSTSSLAPKPLAASGMWKGTNSLFIPLLNGNVEVFNQDGELVDTILTGSPAVDHIDCGVAGDSNILAIACQGLSSDDLKLYNQQGVLTATYSSLGNITFIALDEDYLVLSVTTGSGPSATTTCRILDMNATTPFSTAFLLNYPTGGTVFPGTVVLDYNYPFVLVGVQKDGETHLYNVSDARSNTERATSVDSYGGISGIPDNMGRQVHLTGEYALIKGSDTRHWLYSLQKGDLVLEWNAATGTFYYPSGIKNILFGLGSNGACSLFDINDVNTIGTYTIENLSSSSTAQNLTSNDGFDFSVARYENASGSVAVKIPLMMLLEEMNQQSCP